MNWLEEQIQLVVLDEIDLLDQDYKTPEDIIDCIKAFQAEYPDCEFILKWHPPCFQGDEALLSIVARRQETKEEHEQRIAFLKKRETSLYEAKLKQKRAMFNKLKTELGEA